jgi:hypothetical protein
VPIYFIEEDGTPKPVEEITWRRWCEANPNRRLASATVGRWQIVTNFITVDHEYTLDPSYYNPAPLPPRDYSPLLYETAVFDTSGDNRYRWPSRGDALEGHRSIVESLTNGFPIAYQSWVPGKQRPVRPDPRDWGGPQERDAMRARARQLIAEAPTQPPPEGAGLVTKAVRQAVQVVKGEEETIANRFAFLDLDDEKKDE